MALVQPPIRGRVVGALACQRDSYLRALDTEVISCVKWSPQESGQTSKQKETKLPKSVNKNPAPSDLWLIEFADSVFFPEGGGQPSDQGTILPLSSHSSDSIPIKFVQRQGLRCVHHSPQPLPLGSYVRQKIDFQHRWDHMQQHTGQHLLSAIMDTYDNLETLGWGMGSNGGMNYVDLPRKPSDGELIAIQEKCNEAIRNSLPITVETPDDAKDDSLPEDYDKEKGVVRVISIGDIDRNPCCGTHLSQTSHISLILLHYSQPVHSKHCRLYFTAGDRAINLASTSINTVRSIAKLLSSGSSHEEVITNVTKIYDSTSELRKREKKLLAEIAKYEAARVTSVLETGKNAWVHRATEGLDFINTIVFELKDSLKNPGLVVLASGEENKGGHLVLVGDKSSVEGFIPKVKEVVTGIKGGGKGERWQGKVVEWKKGELDILKSLVERARESTDHGCHTRT